MTEMLDADTARNAMADKVRTGQGFIAALDQSGGSTPKALRLYGIAEDSYDGDDEMYDLIHAMRTRIVTSPSFGGERVLGAILFENTMDRTIEGVGSADYLWRRKNVVPFLKADKGLDDAADGAQQLKPIPDLDELCERAVAAGVFGTKMRSVIQEANPAGIEGVVAQQFAIGRQILRHGLVPIIEPEVDIHCPDKAAAEELLRASLSEHLGDLDAGDQVMFKLTIPDVDDFYRPLIDDARVARVVALSGGYSRDDANARLARNHGMIASFSRALTEGLTEQMSDAEFNAALDSTIGAIFAASIT